MLIWHNPIPDAWPTPQRVHIAKGIRAGMPVDPTWRLDTFRWRNDDGDESSTGATFAAVEVTNLTGVNVDSDVDRRLRIGIDQYEATATNADDPEIVPRLEAKLNSGGTWAAVPNSGGGTYVEMDSGSGLTDGNACTNHGLTLSYTFDNDGTQEENSSDGGTLTYNTETQNSYIGEWAVRLLSSGLSDGDVVYFRVTDAGVLLDTYSYGDASDTNPITITVTKSAGEDLVKVIDEACGPDETFYPVRVMNRIRNEACGPDEVALYPRVMVRTEDEQESVDEVSEFTRYRRKAVAETLNIDEADPVYILAKELVKVISEVVDSIERTLFRRKRTAYAKKIVVFGY